MGPKRPFDELIPEVDGSLSEGQFNQQKNATTTDFSGSVKKRLEKSTRTGQACDRCKVRASTAPSLSRLQHNTADMDKKKSLLNGNPRPFSIISFHCRDCTGLTGCAGAENTVRRETRGLLAMPAK
jgi:hypothetical protein